MANNSIAPKKIKEGFIGQKMIVLPPDIIKQVLKNELIKRLYLTAVGYYPHAGYHDRERPSGSSQHILLYCINGTGTITLSGETITLKPNSFFIIPKNISHHYSSSVSDPWSIYWVHFAGENADLLYERLADKINQTDIPHSESRIILFDEIFNLLEKSFDSRNMELINLKLHSFIASFIYPDEAGHVVVNDPVSSSISFMKENLNRNFAIEELAKQQHLSVSHYCRLFRSKTGTSPNQYFNQLKIQKSCQYLYFTDMHIKEICTAVGFDDPFYFSRSFKRITGTSPSGYKNQHKH